MRAEENGVERFHEERGLKYGNTVVIQFCFEQFKVIFCSSPGVVIDEENMMMARCREWGV